MTLRLKILTALAVIHVGIVVMGATNLRVQNKGAIGEIITWYGALTGAERGFGFFAPQVNTQGRANFHILTPKGVVTRTLEAGASQEAALRINNLGSKFWQVLDEGKDPLRHSMAASLAGKMFAEYPDAEKVAVSFEIFALVSMQDYREGKRPQWRPIYRVEFERRKQGV